VCVTACVVSRSKVPSGAPRRRQLYSSSSSSGGSSGSSGSSGSGSRLPAGVIQQNRSTKTSLGTHAACASPTSPVVVVVLLLVVVGLLPGVGLRSAPSGVRDLKGKGGGLGAHGSLGVAHAPRPPCTPALPLSVQHGPRHVQHPQCCTVCL
jgi:hypothetical protein